MAQLIRSNETIACSDGFKMPGYLTRPDRSGKLPALVFIFDALGVSSEMKRVADEFAEEGYAVLMPNLFGRGSWFSCIRTVMKDLMRGQGQGVNDVLATRTWLRECPYADPEHIGIIGFCMGGGFALLLSKGGLFQVAAPFYGRSPDRLDGACPIVASYGAHDKMMLPEVAKVQSETKRLNIPADIKIYPNAGHGFMNKAPNPIIGFIGSISPIHNGYNPEAAAHAKRRVVAFLEQHL